MFTEFILTSILCVAIVGAMAFFYEELKLLQNNH